MADVDDAFYDPTRLEAPLSRPLDYTTRIWPVPMGVFKSPTMPLFGQYHPPRFMQRPVAAGRTAADGPPFEVRPGPLPREYLGPWRRHSMDNPGVGALDMSGGLPWIIGGAVVVGGAVALITYLSRGRR